MATSAIVSSSVNAGTSDDITLAAGATTNVSLFSATTGALPHGCSASIQKKGSNGVYQQHGTLNEKQPGMILEGPGVYRVVKSSGATAFGVDLG